MSATALLLRAPISKVQAAVSTTEGIASSWTRETAGAPKAGESINVVFRDKDGGEKRPNGVRGGQAAAGSERALALQGRPEEWIGTDVTFDLSEVGDQMLIVFGHRNWRDVGEFMAHCSMKWATCLLSLRELLETGSGKAAPDDLKFDNWN